MSKFEALMLEDEDDILTGSPKKKYWDMVRKTYDDKVEDAFDAVVERIAAMELIIGEYEHIEMVDFKVSEYCAQNPETIEEFKKSVYMELAGKLLFKAVE